MFEMLYLRETESYLRDALAQQQRSIRQLGIRQLVMQVLLMFA